VIQTSVTVNSKEIMHIKPTRSCFALLLGALCAAGAVAQQADPRDSANSDIPATTLMGSGPLAAIMEMDRSLPTHTLYRPADLAKAGKLPVVVWGNGACWNVGNSFRWFLSDIASYGYLVIAVGPIEKKVLRTSTDPMTPIPPAPPPPANVQIPPGASKSSQLIDAMDWAMAQNERKDSVFYHRLDTSGVAVMGQSCGGAQALEASVDSRVRTTVLWNSGLFPEPTSMGGGAPLSRSDLKRLLHAPTAFISGDAEDSAYANANANFDLISHVPVLRAYERGVLHSGTYSERNGGEFAGVAVAWLDWQMKKDKRAAKLFVGEDCGLCVNPRWEVRSKKLK
jgi:dienelactone hydrolase